MSIRKKSQVATQSLFFLTALAAGGTSLAAVDNSQKALEHPNNQAEKKPRWLLKDFLAMAQDNPERLINLGDKLFADDRMRITTIEPGLAHEWQHRLAMVSALSELFNPDNKIKTSNFAQYRAKARKIIAKAVLEDPSLLVRDGAVESLRRIFRMQSSERKNWRHTLEEAFLSPKNIMDGEGFFIRETILTAMKESGLGFSRAIKIAAAKDKNTEVRAILGTKPHMAKAASKRRH